jgi:hypothetical protein
MVIRFCASLFLLLMMIPEAIASKRIALVIGNSEYANLPQLAKVPNDARAMREMLTSELGFDVTYLENAGQDALTGGVSEFSGRVGKDDTVFIYFAGHGVSLDGENYILPADVAQPAAGGDATVAGSSVGYGGLIRTIQQKGARIVIAILDASRDNPFEGAAIGLKRGLDRIDVPEGAFLMLSAGLGQKSLDTLSATDDNPNSVFVRNLLIALKMQGLTQIDMAKRVQADVSSAASASGQNQTPSYEDQLADLVTLNTGTDEVFSETKETTEPDALPETKPAQKADAPPKQETVQKAESLPITETAPKEMQTDRAVILEEWKLVSKSGSRVAIQGFKARYGSDPVWGALADEELRRLGKKPIQASQTPRPTPDASADGSLFSDLQAELKRVGCYTGRVDGKWGRTSERALARFSQAEGITLRPDASALETVADAAAGACTQIATPSRREPVVKARPKRQVVSTPRRTPRPRSSVACWSCKMYDYSTQRICVPRSRGNPEINVPYVIQCRRG